MQKIKLSNYEPKISFLEKKVAFLKRKIAGDQTVNAEVEGLGNTRIIFDLDNLATRNSAELLMSSNNITTKNYKIPKWIKVIYDTVDKNKKGVITQKDIDSLDRAKEGIGSIYRFEAGMTLDSFVSSNISVFRNHIKSK